MITKTHTNTTTPTDRSQLQRIQEARDVWREGRAEDALILIGSVKSEVMSDRIKAECFVAEAAFLAERGEFERSLESLSQAAPVIDAATLSVRGAFYHQRARARKELGIFDDALTDYAGASVLWEKAGNREKQGAATLNVAGTYLALGDIEAAQRNIDLAFDLLRGSFYLPQAHDTQAKIYLASGRLAEAVQSISVALATAGDNELWQANFLETMDKIETRLLEALQVTCFSDWERVKVNMVRRALQMTGGSPEKAAEKLGVTRHSVFSFVKTHADELERYRAPKRMRHKPLMKNL